MGERVPNNFSGRACRKTSRHFDPSRCLSDHAGGQFLSIADNPSHSDLPAPKTAVRERQRSILEALIASAAPRDAVTISKALIDEFSTLGRVLSENKESIERVIGLNQRVIALLLATQTAIVEGLRADVPSRILNSTDQRLIDYLIATMGSRSTEVLRIIFLSRSKKLVGDEVICEGSINSINVNARCIFKRAFELSATSLVLVHNHPGGNVEPSSTDIQFTKTLVSLGQPLEIEICDHIVIAGPKWFSFLRQGLL